jgi:carbon starvation protein
MNSLVVAVLAFAGYMLAYRTYGRYLGSKIFCLNDLNITPAVSKNDGIDYVPTKKHIIFGHHFTTIAGLGPIVGPAIGIIWGWLPALLWVFFGSILMGAVHDFSTLVVSSRSGGRNLGDLSASLISPSTRYAFQFIMQLLLLIVLAVFAMIVGRLFEMYPVSVIPVWIEIPIAIWLGVQVRKGRSDTLYSIIAAAALYVSIVASVYFLPPVIMPPLLGSAGTTWAVILFAYTFIASVLPVHTLLQPRDYINSHQLIVAVALLVLGLIIARPDIAAPAINPAASAEGTDIPPLLPLLFITIACGAISGFHSLASSGTTVKQLRKETDALFIGYGSMLWESFLAVLVLMAIAGGLGMGIEKNGIAIAGTDAYNLHYSSWGAASGLSAQLEAFVAGSANLLSACGIPIELGAAIMAVFIVSFANTTLDSSARIQRVALQELALSANTKRLGLLSNRYVATSAVVLAALALCFSQSKGAMLLWPLFGALNQLVAALALGVVAAYLKKTGKNPLIALLPMLFVLIMTVWAMANNLVSFWAGGNSLLLVFSAIILMLTIWLFACGAMAIKSRKI